MITGCINVAQIFGQIVSSVDTRDLGKLLAVHKDVASHLCKRSSEDQAYDVSFLFTLSNAFNSYLVNFRVQGNLQP
jgi:hypothetical protein